MPSYLGFFPSSHYSVSLTYLPSDISISPSQHIEQIREGNAKINTNRNISKNYEIVLSFHLHIHSTTFISNNLFNILSKSQFVTLYILWLVRYHKPSQALIYSSYLCYVLWSVPIMCQLLTKQINLRLSWRGFI